jgi:hypothetical protein
MLGHAKRVFAKGLQQSSHVQQVTSLNKNSVQIYDGQQLDLVDKSDGHGKARSSPILVEIISRNVFMAQITSNSGKISEHMKPYRTIRLDHDIEYLPLCDDFGPMSMGSVFAFITKLDNELSKLPLCKVIFEVDQGIWQALNSSLFVFTLEV